MIRNSVIDTELQRSEVRRDESISVLEGSGKRWIDGSTSASWKGQKSHGVLCVPEYVLRNK